MEFPENLKYTKEHEWISLDGDIATVGITAFAQSELGDVVYVDITELDEDLNEGDVFGTVEAVKTVADLYMPVSGKVIKINEALETSPENVNNDPYQSGWMIKIQVSDSSEFDALMDVASYKALVS